MKQYKVKNELTIITKEGKELTLQPGSIFNSEDSIEIAGIEELLTEPIYETYKPWWFADYGILDIWKMGYTGKGVKVAVLDSGIFLKNGHPHEDLLNVKPENLFDVTNSEGRMIDHRGHGIHISGIIKASNNGKGVTGIAHNCDFYFSKITHVDKGDSLQYLIDGIKWAISQQVNIVNISSGWFKLKDSDIKRLHEVVKICLEENILIVSAAGNKDSVSGDDFYPAVFEESLSVGAVDMNNSPIDISVAKDRIDIYAPGERIYSTSNEKYKFYKEDRGSSQACAYVTGVAALITEALFSMNKQFTPFKVKKILKDQSIIQGNYRIVNPLNSIKHLLQ